MPTLPENGLLHRARPAVKARGVMGKRGPRFDRRIGYAVDFNQVRYFLALADCLNFTRAAERCNVSQPALTQAIRRLENELGGELIRREGRDSELTTLGRSLRGYFEEIERT